MMGFELKSFSEHVDFTTPLKSVSCLVLEGASRIGGNLV